MLSSLSSDSLFEKQQNIYFPSEGRLVTSCEYPSFQQMPTLSQSYLGVGTSPHVTT